MTAPGSNARRAVRAVSPGAGQPSGHGSRPDLIDTIEKAAASSDAERADIDPDACLVTLNHLIVGIGAHYLRLGGHLEAADEFETFRARTPLSIDMLWEHLARQAAFGAATQRQIAEHFTNGDAVAVLTDLLNGGEMRG